MMDVRLPSGNVPMKSRARCFARPSKVLSLPMFPELTTDQIDRIAAALGDTLK